jgi:hypothetical protein
VASLKFVFLIVTTSRGFPIAIENIRTDYYYWVKIISAHLGTLPAAITDPEELDPMPMSGVRRRLGHPLIQRLVHRQFQIDDRAAPFTDKVVMGSNVGVEAIKGAAEIYLPDQPLIHEDIEVAVHRTHA